jgi:cytosine/adenosine deaminase-related metal-dependent hydrolase
MKPILIMALTVLAVLSGCAPGTREQAQPEVSGAAVAARPPSTPSVPSVVRCAAQSPAVAQTCTVRNADKRTNGGRLVGQVLTAEAVYLGGAVQWNADGIITRVGCSEDIGPPVDVAEITCPAGIISPGMINAHDHLTYDQNWPGDWGDTRYDRRNEWRKGLNGKPRIEAPRSDREKPLQVAWAELRHVMAGTTSIAGSGGSAGLARNVDVADLQRGLEGGVVRYDTFPLGDWSDVEGHTDTCDYPQVVGRDVLENLIFLPHVAEGIDAAAHNEILCLTGRGTNPESRGVDLAAPNASFIHAVAGDLRNAEVLRDRDMSVVWSPRSNISLYGNTAPVTLYASYGINLALASDWTPSGSMNQFRELACAWDFNESYLDGYFSSHDLWRMVTGNAAQAVGFSDQIGALAAGILADIMVVSASEPVDGHYAAVIGSSPASVALVLRAGVPLYGDDETIAALTAPGDCELLPGDVCGRPKRACLMRETGHDFGDYLAQNPESYPLYYCGVPEKEPTCKPSRPGEYTGDIAFDDTDGDGIENSMDNCPAIFNPPRPMDQGTQLNLCAFD